MASGKIVNINATDGWKSNTAQNFWYRKIGRTVFLEFTDFTYIVNNPNQWIGISTLPVGYGPEKTFYFHVNTGATGLSSNSIGIGKVDADTRVVSIMVSSSITGLAFSACYTV